ncbi:cold and drought-regulated protein CORA-like [Vicia villosa]|uniref:cold and drought-regulated protein CORA-like n=1 Tax=Vicia villosa TaxID=3911 RepID=UPI00273B04BF|nr:cold and drought-regulated protein CORA-like [Vicia villosa]
MDSKKAILLFGILVMILHIFSLVSARNLFGTSTNIKEEVVEKSNKINDAKYGYYGGGNHSGGYHGGGGHQGGGGYHGGSSYRRSGNRDSYCHNGCCDGFYYNSCGRCC